MAPQVVTDCDPLIEDELGDTSLPTIDILSSSISYDVATNTLIFEHVVDDFIRHHEPGDGTHYDLHFTWDGLDYSAEAWISATGVENFAIVRQRRAPMHSSVAWVDLGTPEGHFDPAADTVTLRVSLDEFNEGERSASASEGHPPPQELKAGSQLTRLRLYARASRSNTTYSDHGYDYKGCNYVVGP